MQIEHSIPDYVNVVRQGIAKNFKSERPKKVIIVGAGLAGLSAAYELLEAGHDPMILEAQHRVGGQETICAAGISTLFRCADG